MAHRFSLFGGFPCLITEVISEKLSIKQMSWFINIKASICYRVKGSFWQSMYPANLHYIESTEFLSFLSVDLFGIISILLFLLKSSFY